MNRSAADRASLIALCVLLLVAFGFGGGGSRFGLANLVVQLAALTALAIRFEPVLRFWRESPWALRCLIAATLALPVLQIIPLPEQVWSMLPGRQLVSRSLAMTGQSGWMPWSLDPLRTLLALSALITPLAVLMIGWSLPRQNLINLGWLVAGLGIVTTLWGATQLNPTGDAATLFGSRDPGSALLGSFANRNSTGLLLTFSLGLAALLPAPRPHPAVLAVRVAVCLLLLVAIILTKSRTALVLALIPLGLAALKGLWWTLNRRAEGTSAPTGTARPALVIIAAIALLGIGVGGVVVAAPGRIGETLERFEARDDPRRFIWEDAAYSVERYWPAGAGMGSFDEVFQVDETLENLTMRTAGRAHNDYIELAIEAGIPGLMLAGLWLVLCGWLTWQARRSPIVWVGWAGAGFLLAIALQSITDYPLRNQTILAFGGFALLLLARSATASRRERA